MGRKVKESLRLLRRDIGQSLSADSDDCDRGLICTFWATAIVRKPDDVRLLLEMIDNLIEQPSSRCEDVEEPFPHN